MRIWIVCDGTWSVGGLWEVVIRVKIGLLTRNGPIKTVYRIGN